MQLLFEHVSKTNYKNWSNMNLLFYISRSFHLINGPNEMAILKELLCDVWKLKANDTKCKPFVISRANMLCSNVDSVLKSRPAILLIEANVEKQSEASAKSRLTTSITDQIGASSGAIASSSSPSSAAAVASPPPSSSAVKRRRKIMPKDFKGLSHYKQAALLVDSCGLKDILDFRQSFIIPRRLQAITNKITKKLDVLLTPLLKAEEHALLKKISEAKKMDNFIESIESISVIESADELVFIKMLVEKFVVLHKYGHLKRDHNECWYRVNVYSEAFDLLFLSSNLFESKRAECESVIIKTLKELKQLPTEQKNCRLDFILESNSNDRLFELLFCEDKPKEKKSENDIEKADLVRSSSLKYWLTLLPYKECSHYIESISCHFNKLTLRIYGTKLIDDRLIHYVKKETSIPNNGSGSQLADYITTILSLFRHVILNLKKITLMCEIALQDDLNYLNNSTSLNTFREDSPDTDLQSSPSSLSSPSSQSSSDSSAIKKWDLRICLPFLVAKRFKNPCLLLRTS